MLPNNFVGEKANRKPLFSKFSTIEVPIKESFLTKSTRIVALWTVLVPIWKEFLYAFWLIVNVCTLTGGWGGGWWLGQFVRPLQLFQPCYGPALVQKVVTIVLFALFLNQPRYWLSVGARPSRPVAILLGLVSLDGPNHPQSDRTNEPRCISCQSHAEEIIRLIRHCLPKTETHASLH